MRRQLTPKDWIRHKSYGGRSGISCEGVQYKGPLPWSMTLLFGGVDILSVHLVTNVCIQVCNRANNDDRKVIASKVRE